MLTKLCSNKITTTHNFVDFNCLHIILIMVLFDWFLIKLKLDVSKTKTSTASTVKNESTSTADGNVM